MSLTTLATAPPAGATTQCSAPMVTAGTATVTCPLGTADTWMVPSEVTQATFDVQGAAGGTAINGASAAGNGGHTTATLTVSPGVTYYVAVGSKGGHGTAAGGGAGGAPGGGSSGPGVGCSPCASAGGGGGGTSVVATAPITATTTSWVLAAGGGGGAGGSGGQPGGSGGGLTGGDGTSGGTGGNQDGTSGSHSHLNGGSNSGCDGGGGGAGYYGGGTPPCGGGAGGGSGLAPSAADFSTATNTGDGSVTITYTLSPPTVSITGPQDGVTYRQDVAVDSAFNCTESANGTGISSCVDQQGHPSGSPLDTSTTGQHTLTVTATSNDGLSATSTVHYNVAAPPTVAITGPHDGVTYPQGAPVDSAFSCTEGAAGTGISSCVDQQDHPSGSPLDTSTTGQHILTVTATSNDGLSATASVHYNVAAPPAVTITSPKSGAAVVLGQRVPTAFRCAEGPGGPGIVSCSDSNGTPSPGGKLDTTNVGPHRYTVTAVSQDGQSTHTAIAYTVMPPTPVLAVLRISPHAFDAATHGPTLSPAGRPAARISYRDTLPAMTTFRVLRCTGRRGRCTQLTTVGVFTHSDRAGVNRVRFSGRLLGHALSAGRYVLQLTAALAGQTSAPTSTTFVIRAR